MEKKMWCLHPASYCHQMAGHTKESRKDPSCNMLMTAYDNMNNVPQNKGQLENHLLLKHHLQSSHVLTTTKIPSIPY